MCWLMHALAALMYSMVLGPAFSISFHEESLHLSAQIIHVHCVKWLLWASQLFPVALKSNNGIPWKTKLSIFEKYIRSQSRYNRASRVVEGGTEYTVRYCHRKN